MLEAVINEMDTMKNILFGLAAISMLSACSHMGYQLTANDIQYIEDPRSGLCFAVVHERASSSKIGMTTVDCNDVEELLSNEANNIAEETPPATKQSEKLVDRKNYFSIGPVFSSF